MDELIGKYEITAGLVYATESVRNLRENIMNIEGLNVDDITARLRAPLQVE